MSHEGVMMACGCAAVGVCSRRSGVVIDPPIPVCITHDCIVVAAAPPDLTGRTARCSYFGPIRFRSFESNYVAQTGCSRTRCTCELPSDPGLPFFRHESTKPFDQFYCGCAGWD